jgi:predicted RNase H-like HicB family nuclease
MEHLPITQAEIEEARRYPIVIAWSDEDQLYIATIPDLDAVQTHGSTIAEAGEKAIEVIADWLYGHRVAGYPIPAPSPALSVH